MIALLTLLACGGEGSTPAGPTSVTSKITVGFCDKAENTRLVRVGIGGSANTGETEVLPLRCEPTEVSMGCVFQDVSPGTYRVQNGAYSALVYAGPAPSPSGDVRVELACQAGCKHDVSFTAEGCATSGAMRVYSADPAPVATLVFEGTWAVGAPTTIDLVACTRLIAELDAEGCGTTVVAIASETVQSSPTLAVKPQAAVDVRIVDPDGKPIPNAYLSDDALRTTHTGPEGAIQLFRPANAPSSIWVQAPGFGGRMAKLEPDGAATTITLLPTRPVKVTCTQAGQACAGPIVYVGDGMDARTCEAKTAADWVCDATAGDSVWARFDTKTGARVKVEGDAANVAL